VEITGGHPEIIYNPRNTGGLARLCGDITLHVKNWDISRALHCPRG